MEYYVFLLRLPLAYPISKDQEQLQNDLSFHAHPGVSTNHQDYSGCKFQQFQFYLLQPQ